MPSDDQHPRDPSRRRARIPASTLGALLFASVLIAAFAACTAESWSGSATPDSYPHEHEPIGTVRASYDGALGDSLAVATFRNIHRLFPTRAVAPSPTPRVMPTSARTLVSLAIPHGDSVVRLAAWLEANRVTGLLVIDSGRIAMERYRLGNGPRTRWMSMSIAKSITSTLVGAALRDGRIGSLDDPVTRYVPSLAGSAYDGVSIRDLLYMRSGVRWSERYTDSTSDRRRLLEAQIAQRPGAALEVMRALPRAAPPGTVHNYSTGETQVLAEVLRGAVGMPLAEYLSARLWRPAGMEAEALWWLDSPGGVEIGGSGLSATLRDYGRIGQFLLEDGIVGTDTILPPGWVADATRPGSLRDGTPIDYGYMWWTATTPEDRRDRAFTAQGIHGQYLYVNPAAHVVIVVWSAQPQPTGGAVLDEEALFRAVVRELRGETGYGARSTRSETVRGTRGVK